jgi:hypothetical protein
VSFAELLAYLSQARQVMHVRWHGGHAGDSHAFMRPSESRDEPALPVGH